jgi:hypothetical protein
MLTQKQQIYKSLVQKQRQMEYINSSGVAHTAGRPLLINVQRELTFLNVLFQAKRALNLASPLCTAPGAVDTIVFYGQSLLINDDDTSSLTTLIEGKTKRKPKKDR